MNNEFSNNNGNYNNDLPPIEKRYESASGKREYIHPDYDDSYNYAKEEPVKKIKKKKSSKYPRGFAGILAAVCVASVIGGSLFTGYVVMPLINGSTNNTVASTPVQIQSEDIVAESDAVTSTPAPSTQTDSAITYNYNNPVVDVAKKITPCVVEVKVYNQQFVPGQSVTDNASGYGTGYVLTSDGYILTNNHVIENGNRIKVALQDGTEYDATVAGADESSDVAVLKIEASGLPAVTIGNSDNVQVGELVVAVGNPVSENLANTVTVGYISALNRTIQAEGRTYNVLQTDAAINSGNSGGPLVNAAGEVIGMTTLKNVYAGVDSYGNLIESDGIGFAIPINYVMEIANELMEKGSIEKPGIGINYYPMTAEDAKLWETPRGALISSVVEGSSAEAAGLKANDIITAVDGASLDSDEIDLQKIIAEKNIGDVLKFTVWRGGQTLDIDVEIININAIS